MVALAVAGILVLFVGVASELRMFSSGNPLDCHQKCS